MVSNIDTAKGAHVTLIKALAVIYGLAVGLTRESTDVQVRAAFKKVSCKAHPDRGGTTEHQTGLNTARDAWEDALRSKVRGKHPRGKDPHNGVAVAVAKRDTKTHRFQGLGVLLTYQKFSDTACWKDFLEHAAAHLLLWKVRYWSATMETNAEGTYHLHLMLRFFKAQERYSQTFAFTGIWPNSQTNNLLGEGWCKKKLQQSLDRAFFYVWANKLGPKRNKDSEPCVAGNYQHVWTTARSRYAVLAK